MSNIFIFSLNKKKKKSSIFAKHRVRMQLINHNTTHTLPIAKWNLLKYYLLLLLSFLYKNGKYWFTLFSHIHTHNIYNCMCNVHILKDKKVMSLLQMWKWDVYAKCEISCVRHSLPKKRKMPAGWVFIFLGEVYATELILLLGYKIRLVLLIKRWCNEFGATFSKQRSKFN